MDIQPVTPSIGAVLTGVDVTSATPNVIEAIRSALLRHKVVFFRDQDIQAEDFVEFAEQFGPTTLHHPIMPVTPASGGNSEKAKASIWERDNSYRSDHWHTDVTFIDRPVSISLLRCMTCPEVGGDTLFANTVTAYERLPESLRTLADSLRVVHSTGRVSRERGSWKSNLGAFVTEHPVVRVLSETGERSLILGSFAEQIVGYTSDASAALLKTFQDYILKPENVVRWRWRPGDLVMWDNRATQHYAVNDYGDAPRLMQRLTVAGGIPIGTDGRSSVAICGDASPFSPIGPA